MIVEGDKITYKSAVVNEQMRSTSSSKDTSLTALNIGSELSKRMGSNVAAILEKFDTLGNGGEYSHIGISTKNVYRELRISTIYGIPGETGWIPNTKAETDKADTTSTKLGSAETLNAPFQFNKNDDVRSNPYYPNLGRVYNKYIRSNFPIVSFEVGRLKYFGDFMGLYSKVGDGNHADLKGFIRGDSRSLVGKGWIKLKGLVRFTAGLITFPFQMMFGKDFAVFQNDTPLFKLYYNEMISEVAVMMGLGQPANVKGDNSLSTLDDPNNQKSDANYDGAGTSNYGGSMEKLNLLYMLPGMSKNISSMKKAIESDYFPFLIHKGVSVSESISNQTDTHPLAAQMNSESAESEAANQAGGMKEMSKDSNILGNMIGMVTDKTKQAVAKAATGESGYILSGDGRIQLPDVWSNSTFSRSYSLNFKFTTPLGSDIAVFENTYLPFLMLLTMATPRQVGKMSYTSPFIIRAAAKGWFSCPMGIIESLNIERGEEKNNITDNGFPRTIKVTMSIKDLMPNLVMSMSAGLFSALHSKNIGMRQYMAVLGGLSMAESKNMKNRWDRFWAKTKIKLSNTFDSENFMYSMSNSFVAKPITRIVKNNFNSTPY